MNKQKLVSFRRSVWFFPAVLFGIVCLLTLFAVHGSSVGMHNQLAHKSDKTYHDSNLLFGEPRQVRSEEWLITTPLTAEQARNDFNASSVIGQGPNVDAVLDVPVWDWPTLFKPQNWAFFVLPLGNAFAFKWWFMGLALIVSCYFFVITMLPKRRTFAVLASLALFFAPYVQWWYQAHTLMSLAYGFLLLTTALKLLQATNLRTRVGWSGLFGYAAVGLALIQYLPFILSIAAGVIAFLLGYVLENWQKEKERLQSTLTYLGGATVVAGGIIWAYAAAYWQTTPQMPEKLSQNLWHLLGGFLNGQLQDLHKAMHYFTNQSEAAGFIMLAPFMMVPSVYIIYRGFRKHSDYRYTLLFLNLLLVAFMLRFIIELSGDAWWAEVIRTIPNNRIMLGIGFVAFLQLLVLAKDQERINYPKRLMRWGTLLVFMTLLITGSYLRTTYPGYIVNLPKIVLLAGLMTLLFYLFLRKKLIGAAAILLFVSWYSTYRINPLYHGLSPLTQKQASAQCTTPAIYKTNAFTL